MSIRAFTAVALILLAAEAPGAAQGPPPPAPTLPQAPPGASQLDFLAGDWEISDPTGAVVGRSHIEVQAPGAMLFELRRVGEGAQPLWFAFSERDAGWTQLFVGAIGMIRQFSASSAAGAWPMVLTQDVVLRDGAPARFRLTMARQSDDETTRLLERSRDSGATWTVVFNYRYRRIRA